MAPSFMSEYLTMSESLTRFIRQNNAEVATRSSYAASLQCPSYNLGRCLGLQRITFIRIFPL